MPHRGRPKGSGKVPGSGRSSIIGKSLNLNAAVGERKVDPTNGKVRYKYEEVSRPDSYDRNASRKRKRAMARQNRENQENLNSFQVDFPPTPVLQV